MSFKAVLFINDEKRNILNASQVFSRFTDASNRPTTKPVGSKLEFVIESTGNDSFFYYNMFSPTVKCKGEIIFYKRDGLSILFKMEFGNAQILNLSEHFNASGTMPLHMKISIGWGIMRIRDLIFEETWNPSNPFIEIEETVIEQEEQEDRIDLKFIANLRRLDNYKGEFGFDWMRDDYKTICDDYNKLKKEYTPIKIHNQDYFVPWLSMFPNQQNVKLKLVITKIEGSAKDTDIIKFPSKSGIKFEPNQIKVSEANGKEINVICETSLNNDIIISLLDKDDEEVGKINVFKNANHEQLQFNITPVRILRSVSPQSDKDAIENMIDHSQGFGDKSKDINDDLQNLQKYLNTQSLNQALLQASIGKVYDVIIDEDKWIADDLIIDEGCAFKGSLLDKFEEEFKKQHPKTYKNRGITVFLSPLENVGDDGKGGAGGYGNLGDIDSKNLAIFETNLWNKESFAHEIAHVAGLEHSFKEKGDLNESQIFERNRFIKQVDERIKYMMNNSYTNEEISTFWNDYKDDYKKHRSTLNVYYRNLHKFKQSKTDNFMDYYNSRETFWKFQWKALQDDILKFYK